MANDVQFRRVHGRIVPIHINPQHRQGAGLVGSGVLAAVGGAKIGAGIHRDAAGLEHLARGQQILAKKSFNAVKGLNRAKALDQRLHALKISSGNFSAANRLFKKSRNVRTASAVLGGSLIATGVNKLLPKKVKEKMHENAAVAGVVNASIATGTAFAVRNAWYGALTKRTFMSGAKEAFKKIKQFGPKV